RVVAVVGYDAFCVLRRHRRTGHFGFVAVDGHRPLPRRHPRGRALGERVGVLIVGGHEPSSWGCWSSRGVRLPGGSPPPASRCSGGVPAYSSMSSSTPASSVPVHRTVSSPSGSICSNATRLSR